MNYWKALFSPFKPFKPRFYFGKVAIGTPYFFPRRLVSISREEAANKAYQEYTRLKEKGKDVSFDDILEYTLSTKVYTAKKIGFDFVRLGYKTKWSDTDYRFEWAPLWSFVFFKWQFVVKFIAPEQEHYWTCWLYYENHTDKSKSVAERVEQCRKEYPCTWTIYSKNPKTGETTSKETVDYYTKILKKKWLQ